MKGKVYQINVRSAILYGSETCCLNEREVESLRRTEKVMVSAMCGVLIEEMVRVAAVTWYGQILRKEESNILKGALNFEVTGRSLVDKFLVWYIPKNLVWFCGWLVKTIFLCTVFGVF